MTKHSENDGKFRVADLSANRPKRFSLTPDEASCARIAKDLDLLALRKLRFDGVLQADGKSNWRLDAQLGATVVQPCSVTLAPVTTRIEEKVTRSFVRDWPGVDPEADEVEMPEDDTIEPLGEVIDVRALMQEALSLALPPYPRSADAALEQANFAPPGTVPLTDADAKPFAALAALKRKLGDKED